MIVRFFYVGKTFQKMLTLPNSVNSFGSQSLKTGGAQSRDSTLASIVLPFRAGIFVDCMSTTTTPETSSFLRHSHARKATFTGGTSVSNQAFQRSRGLWRVTFGPTITKHSIIGSQNDIRGLEFQGVIDTLESDSGVFNDCYDLIDLEWRYSGTALPRSTYWGCSSLTHIDVPRSVESIGKQSFYYIHHVESITFHMNVTEIADDQFAQISSLKTIYHYWGTDVLDALKGKFPSSVTFVKIGGSDLSQW